MRPALAALALCALSTPAAALTGTELYKNCMQDRATSEALSCFAYIRGFVDGAAVISMVGSADYCPPDAGLDARQARLIVEKYLRENPDKLHKEAGILTGIALMRAFRCPADGKK